MAIKVFVTGGSGVLGREIVSSLHSSNYDVITCGRVMRTNVDAIWDISKQSAPDPDCDAEIVVHSAARVGYYSQPLSDAIDLLDVNVNGTARVANWCVSKRVQKVILISGAIVYGGWIDLQKSETDPVKPWVAGPYAVSKWCSEQVAHMVECFGCNLTILRFSSLYGPGYDNGLIQRMLRRSMRTGSIRIEPPFNDAFDFLYVSDAANAVKLSILKEEGGLWNVGSGKLTTISDLADVCAAKSAAEVVFSEAPQLRPRRIINWVDDQKARREFGHENLVTLAEGVSEINKCELDR